MLSVVVTSHHDHATCYLTVFAVKSQLESSNIVHEIIVVADGGTEYKWETANVRCLRGNFGSPQASRDAGIRAARYPTVLLLEAHVVLSDVSKLLLEHQYLGSAITFPIRAAEGPEMFTVYAHETDWDGNLWYRKLIYSPVKAVSHKTSQFGHSCFLLDRKWYVESGGYTQLLRGWGGEEPLLCLKAWLLGREVWQVPSVAHYHYLTPGAHQEKPYLASNLATVGYVLGGRKRPGLKLTPDVEKERLRICQGPFGGDLDKLRSYFYQHNVVN